MNRLLPVTGTSYHKQTKDSSKNRWRKYVYKEKPCTCTQRSSYMLLCVRMPATFSSRKRLLFGIIGQQSWCLEII